MPFVDRSQVRACFAKNDPKWPCRAWLKRYGMPQARGPEPVKTEDPKSAADRDRRAFAADFVLKCAAAGVTAPAEVARVAAAAVALLTKRAFLGGVPGAETAGAAAGTGLGLAALAPLIGTVGLPMAAGFGLGGLAAGAKNQTDVDDAETLRIQAQAHAYRRRAAAAAAHAQVRKLVAGDPSKYVPLG